MNIQLRQDNDTPPELEPESVEAMFNSLNNQLFMMRDATINSCASRSLTKRDPLSHVVQWVVVYCWLNSAFEVFYTGTSYVVQLSSAPSILEPSIYAASSLIFVEQIFMHY
jgi:hypothetical protein